MSKIQWTDETWNPVSAGWDNCYAMAQVRRLVTRVVSEFRSGVPLSEVAARNGITAESAEQMLRYWHRGVKR